jgi:EAL domain-containing protein (putative c-di-GMP-specific phosphodiesterase class I)/GGDEF domain-containing protein
MIDADGVPYRERLDEILLLLVRHGSMGVLLIDLSQLSQIEHDYGSTAYEKVLGSATQLFQELRGGEVRSTDMLASSDKGGDAFLVFLSPKRTGGPAHISELEAAAARIENYFNEGLSKLASPYVRRALKVPVGFGLVLHNPLVMPERLVARLVNEAWECVRYQQLQQAFKSRAQVLEIILNDNLKTLFQPIFKLDTREVMGYEALSRGPEGTAFQSPLRLFETAAEADLVFELDRACRLRALRSGRGLPEPTRLFINILPSSMYDPDFHGAGLLDMLEKIGLAPEQVVLEITEKYAIENYALFGEAVRNFTEIGISIAVDDIGAGHSGLEKIANLNPKFLKFDMELVRDIDASYVRQEMVKALKIFADKMDSTIIAEGIERQEELDTLLQLGVDHGQGYLLGRPGQLGWKDAAPKLRLAEKRKLRKVVTSSERAADS